MHKNVIVYIAIQSMALLLLFTFSNESFSGDYNNINAGNIDDVKLTINAKNKFHPGEDVVFYGKISNNYLGTITVVPISFSGFKVFIKSDKDYHHLHGKYLINELIETNLLNTIHKGESYSFKRIISNAHDSLPLAPGKYYMYTTYTNHSEEFDNIKLWTGKLTSNVIEFDIIEE